jgi:hypothetical protein
MHAKWCIQIYWLYNVAMLACTLLELLYELYAPTLGAVKET